MDGGIPIHLLESSGTWAITLPVGPNKISARLCQFLTDSEEGCVKKATVANHQRHVILCEL